MQFTRLLLSIILCNQSDQSDEIKRVTLYFSAKHLFCFFQARSIVMEALRENTATATTASASTDTDLPATDIVTKQLCN